ncbi:hypothetical protein [Sulfuriflexus mobilis]|uniref:hypothetical protein n=1 Tax=Sulfuriflexus mobilis TaxID=1811807 RepID=UPI000F83E0EB|nr:hypothetical protein [Sulfuriflexus mobilis]
MKGFDEHYSNAVKGRIAGIEPKDYTRMGVTIRYQSRLLNEVDARTKLLITLADGKPDDFDGYRGEVHRHFRATETPDEGLGYLPSPDNVDRLMVYEQRLMYGTSIIHLKKLDPQITRISGGRLFVPYFYHQHYQPYQ